MTFVAILVKEMRLRMRRERTIWILVVYVLSLGLLAWLTLNSSFASGTSINQWSTIGSNLYHLLTAVQILLILFITPAFTATVINSEKERQTYEMLICSRLSSFSMITGKLFAGLSSSLLLIAASIPLFSLIFFLGGIAPLTILQDLLTFVITTVLVATLGVLCSTIFPRPAISTAVTYMVVLLWLVTPIMLQYLVPTTGFSSPVGVTRVINAGKGGVVVIQGVGPVPIGIQQQTQTLPLLAAWNPLTALNNTTFLPFVSPAMIYTINGIQQNTTRYAIAGLAFTPHTAYAILSSIAIALFFGLSLFFAKPNPIGRLRVRIKHKNAVSVLHQETPVTVTT
jgi:ABC-type transport system involved in multi-copper enzyme maturation permease subunit